MFLSSSVRSAGLSRGEGVKEGGERGREEEEEVRGGKEAGYDRGPSSSAHSLARVARMRTSGLRREMVSKHSSRTDPMEPRELRDPIPVEGADLRYI